MSDADKPPSFAQAQVEAHVAQLAHALRAVLPPGLGFALMLFDFGDGGTMAYASNGSRQDMIRALRESIAHLERGA